jgi:hypothetical protein
MEISIMVKESDCPNAVIVPVSEPAVAVLLANPGHLFPFFTSQPFLFISVRAALIPIAVLATHMGGDCKSRAA